MPVVPVPDAVLRRLYRDRAQRSLQCGTPNLNAAIEDARCAECARPAGRPLWPPGPDGRQRKALLDNLETSIAEGRRAENAYGQMSLSVAYVLRANYKNDPAYTLQEREKDLSAAVASIRKAEAAMNTPQVARQQGLSRYLYHLAAGNAYEDLAWLVERDPIGQYESGPRRILEAAKAEPDEPQPYCSIGRCYYKALAETYLPARQLKRPNGDPLENETDLMDQCEQALDAAIDKSEKFAADTVRGEGGGQELPLAASPVPRYRLSQYARRQSRQ